MGEPAPLPCPPSVPAFATPFQASFPSPSMLVPFPSSPSSTPLSFPPSPCSLTVATLFCSATSSSSSLSRRRRYRFVARDSSVCTLGITMLYHTFFTRYLSLRRLPLSCRGRIAFVRSWIHCPFCGSFLNESIRIPNGDMQALQAPSIPIVATTRTLLSIFPWVPVPGMYHANVALLLLNETYGVGHSERFKHLAFHLKAQDFSLIQHAIVIYVRSWCSSASMHRKADRSLNNYGQLFR